MLPRPTAEPRVAKKTAKPEEKVSLFFMPYSFLLDGLKNNCPLEAQIYDTT